MNLPEESLDHLDLESSAATVVGRIVFAFSLLEFNLGLCLRSIAGASDVDALNPLVERLTFKNKLDALLEIIESRFSAKPECIAEFRQWHKNADEIRAKRNAFVHGRWAVLASAQQVVNVAPGMPSSKPQRESRFTLHELNSQLAEIEQVAGSFEKLRAKWQL
jgi:hypothetical protein